MVSHAPISDKCLFSMTLLRGLLLLTNAVAGEEAAGNIKKVFAPALGWIATWLPVFYVPSLVVLPTIVGKA